MFLLSLLLLLLFCALAVVRLTRGLLAERLPGLARAHVARWRPGFGAAPVSGRAPQAASALRFCSAAESYKLKTAASSSRGPPPHPVASFATRPRQRSARFRARARSPRQRARRGPSLACSLF